MERLGLSSGHLMNDKSRTTKLGETVLEYYRHRADMLNNYVAPRLLDADAARAMFEELQKNIPTKRTPPMNKQKGEKKAPAYFTASINLLIEQNTEGMPCDYDPRELTTVTMNGAPLRTLARRVDGAFPAR